MSVVRLMSGHLAHITDLRSIYARNIREVNAKLMIYLDMGKYLRRRRFFN